VPLESLSECAKNKRKTCQALKVLLLAAAAHQLSQHKAQVLLNVTKCSSQHDTAPVTLN
jgi:hypothetical protein